MGYFLAALAIISAVVSAAGTVMQAQSQSNAAKYNADVNKKNAEATTQQAMFDAEQTRAQNRRVLASQRAAFSASGIDPDTGSAADVRADSAQEGELDALVSIYTGRSGANASLARARLNRMEASSAKRAGAIGATSTLLGGAAQAGYSMKF